METFCPGRCLFVDIDGTLVTPQYKDAYVYADAKYVTIGHTRYRILEQNIETMKRFADNPTTHIVAWSLGGATWAETVIRALGLQDYVELCISKPTWFLDDLPHAGFVGPQDPWVEARLR